MHARASPPAQSDIRKEYTNNNTHHHHNRNCNKNNNNNNTAAKDLVNVCKSHKLCRVRRLAPLCPDGRTDSLV
jgi:hypothetical protein